MWPFARSLSKGLREVKRLRQAQPERVCLKAEDQPGIGLEFRQ
jgi:hypothetical protein